MGGKSPFAVNVNKAKIRRGKKKIKQKYRRRKCTIAKWSGFALGLYRKKARGPHYRAYIMCALVAKSKWQVGCKSKQEKEKHMALL